MSPEPTVEDFVPATISGLGNPPAIGGARRQLCGLGLVLPRAQLAAGRFGALDEHIDRRHVDRRRRAWRGDELRRVGRLREESGEGRLGARAIAGSRGAIDVQVQDFALRTQAVEPGGVPGGFAFGQDIRQLSQAVAGRRQLPFPHLGSGKLREGDPQVGARPPHLFIGAAAAGVDQRRGSAHLQPALPVHRQQLTDGRDVLRRPGHRFPVDRDPRVWPAARGEHSARATSTDDRIARTRGLAGDRRASASDSVSGNDCAPANDGSAKAASVANNTTTRIQPRLKTRDETDDGRARQIRSGGERGRGAERRVEARWTVWWRSVQSRRDFPLRERGREENAVGTVA